MDGLHVLAMCSFIGLSNNFFTIPLEDISDAGIDVYYSIFGLIVAVGLIAGYVKLRRR